MGLAGVQGPVRLTQMFAIIDATQRGGALA
jgi:hypothetical protein